MPIFLRRLDDLIPVRTALRRGAPAALAASCLAFMQSATADPADYVISPIVVEGEREIESTGMPGCCSA